MPIIFKIEGSPRVQKNDLIIMQRKTKEGVKKRFVGHSSSLNDVRNSLAAEMYNQYVRQGYHRPITKKIAVNMEFYVGSAHEPDLDNLPQIVLDAMQGVKIKKFLTFKVLDNDKLVRYESSRKIVEGDDDYFGAPRTEVTIRPYKWWLSIFKRLRLWLAMLEDEVQKMNGKEIYYD